MGWVVETGWTTAENKTEVIDTTGNSIKRAEVLAANPLWQANVGNVKSIILKSRKSTKCVHTTYYNKKSQLFSLENDYSNFLYNSMCFVPDVEGEYKLKLTVTDGCSSGTVNATVIATCNGVPNIIFEPRVGLVSLDGTNTRRVYVNAMRTADPDNDYLTYSWTIMGPDGKSISDVANKDGPIASFVPSRRGDYRCQLTVSDGCSTTQATEIVAVNCQASQLRLSANVSTDEVLYTEVTSA